VLAQQSIRSLRRLLLGTVSAILMSALPLRAAPADTVSGRDPEPPYPLGTRVYFGMWSTHFRDLHRGLNSNQLIALAHRGYYGGTFINSFGDRSIVGGIQRSLKRTERSSSAAPTLGYRMGLLTGYDERFLGIAGKVPVLPFAQILGGLDYRRIGVELAYAGVVGSLAVNYRF
jgi:hypothetical protein